VNDRERVERAPRGIVLLMADQLTPFALPFYGHPLVQAPALTRLAADGVVFDAAYCNFPICAPSRYAMLTGRLPHSIDAFDNACELPSSLPTMAHYLADAGYRTILSGKMHFVGADQLHGYQERLTTDIYPAEFLWVPDWSRGPAHKPTGVGMSHVVDAGPCVRNMQIDYDEEVAHAAVQKIYDLARDASKQPFFLTASFTHPHPPFVAPQEHWDLYASVEIDPPRVGEIAYDALDPHSQWLYIAHGQDRHTVDSEQVRLARRAYYAMISYVDEKIGAVLSALERTGLAEDCVVVFCADHGEMLGERGMWFKQTFFEPSVRVPLVIRWPRVFEPGRRTEVCSLVDLLPTFIDIVNRGQRRVAPIDTLDGHSVAPMLADRAEDWPNEAISEYSAEGVIAPSRMLRRDEWKYVVTRGVAPMLFNLAEDPHELRDLAGSPEAAHIKHALDARLTSGWDADSIDEKIRGSQRRRLFLKSLAQKSGSFPDWTFEARPGDSARFVRPINSGGSIGAKPRSRFPYVEPRPPNKSVASDT
jgi:choline-sulfatase